MNPAVVQSALQLAHDHISRMPGQTREKVVERLVEAGRAVGQPVGRVEVEAVYDLLDRWHEQLLAAAATLALDAVPPAAKPAVFSNA